MKKLPLLLAASILAGCGTQQSTSNASFDGEVFYRERIALPPSARLSVSLEDVSLADAPSVQLASQTREITSRCRWRSTWSTTRSRSSRATATR